MITTSEPHEFWKARLVQAMESARTAPSDRSRAAYLDLARHYWSMHELINSPREDRAEPPRAPVAVAEQTETPRYASVHDALMQAA